MKLHFEDASWRYGIESVCNPPSDWKVPDPESYIGFNAYELGKWAFDYEKHLIDEGYEYICCIEFMIFDSILSIGEFPAKDEDEAMRLLQLAADSLYGKDEAWLDSSARTAEQTLASA